MAKTYSVRITEMSHYQDSEGEREYDGFPTLKLAKEFARRWLRDSLEELRKPQQSPEELRTLWFTFGEDASTQGYTASDELDRFIKHPAIQKERDWAAILKKAGPKIET